MTKACMKWEADHTLGDVNATAQRENYTNKHKKESIGSVAGTQ